MSMFYSSTRLITGRNEVIIYLLFIFLHLFVILFTGGGLPQYMLGYHPPGADTPPGSRPPPQEQTPPSGSRHPPSRHPPRTRHTPPGPDTPPPGSRLQHTIYERPVRILLECILVCKCLFTQKMCRWRKLQAK